MMGAAALALGATAGAQVAVYELDLNETGTTLNYDFYTGGYFICEVPEGTGTFLLTLARNTSKFYAASTNSGELFVVTDGGSRLSAIAADGGSEGANSSLLVTGGKFERTNIGGSISMPVTRRLSGTFQAYSASLVTDEGTFREAVGLAGFSKASMRLDLALTREANNELLSVGEATELVIEELERRGFSEEPGDDDGDTDDGDDDAVDVG